MINLTDSDYPFGIFKQLFLLWNTILFIPTKSFYSDKEFSETEIIRMIKLIDNIFVVWCMCI